MSKRYKSIKVEKDENIRPRLKKLFPNKTMTVTLNILLENFDQTALEGNKRAIWISEETYEKLNRRGNVSETWDDVIQSLLKKKELEPY